MLLEVSNKGRVSEAISILKSKLKPALLASHGIWAELYKNWNAYGIMESGRIAVEINVPPFKKRPMGLIARENNRLYLCHNGRLNPRLQINPSDVVSEIKRKCRDVERADGSRKPYIIVTCLNNTPEILVRDLAEFVRGCQRLAEVEPENLSDSKLKQLAHEKGKKRPKIRIIETLQFERSPEIVALVKRMAKGRCDLCKRPAPFETRNGPYLECHHIKHLADRGPDIVENTVALCPNCHKRMHVLNNKEDRSKLRKVARGR